jgi:hypothetical protein
MNTNLRLVFSAALLIAASALSGCATLVVGLGDATSSSVASADNKVLTASVAWQEPKGPLAYPAYKFHWNEASKSVHDLRWAVASSTLGSGLGTVFMSAAVVIPNQVPTLYRGDLIAIQNNVWHNTDYRTLNVPFVVRLICHAGDSKCFDAFKKSHDGKLYGVSLPGHYTMSQFTFVPRDQNVASAGDSQ